jgi:hypothetical protein
VILPDAEKPCPLLFDELLGEETLDLGGPQNVQGLKYIA